VLTHGGGDVDGGARRRSRDFGKDFGGGGGSSGGGGGSNPPFNLPSRIHGACR
jgi:hypothetical protein